MVFLLMAPQSEGTSRSTRLSSSSTPFWLVQAYSLPSFACSSISSSERESEQADHLSDFSLYHPHPNIFHPPILKTHLHSNTFHYHSNTTIFIPIPPFSFQYHHLYSNTFHYHSNTTILIPIPPFSFQYHSLSFNSHVVRSTVTKSICHELNLL